MAPVRSHLAAGLLLVSGAMLFSTSLNYTPAPSGTLSTGKKGIRKIPNASPRSGLEKNPVEIKEVEEPEEELPVLELPPYRAPYKMFITSVGDAKIGENNQEYIKRKVQHALEAFDSRIEKVHIGVHIETHHHSVTKAHGKSLSKPVDEEDEPTESAAAGSKQGKAGKRSTTPFRIDVRVDMRNGVSIVVGRGTESFPTLLEAIQETYHLLRTKASAAFKRNFFNYKWKMTDPRKVEAGAEVPNVDEYDEEDRKEVQYGEKIRAEAESVYSSIPE